MTTLQFKVFERAVRNDEGEKVDSEYISYLLAVNGKILKMISYDDDYDLVADKCVKFAEALEMTAKVVKAAKGDREFFNEVY